MDKAVLCIAHKAPEQINILLKQLLQDANGCTDIYIHLDKKSEIIKERILKDPHIFFIKNNHSITWGDDSNIRMLIDSFNEIISTGKKYDYFQICTGQDLMIRSGLDDYLEDHNSEIFIYIIKNDRYIKNLLLHKFPKCLQKDLSNNFLLQCAELIYTIMSRIHLIPKKKVDYNTNLLDFYVSYNWSFMPYDVLQYICDFLKKNPGFLTLYYDTKTPEDGFLGTLIRNSPYRDKVTFIEGTETGNSLTYMKKIQGCHVPTLTIKDLNEIEESQCFMARKFDIKQDNVIISYFAKKLINNTQEG